MKLFVVGPTGSIGSVLVARATSMGHEVVGLARTESSAQRTRDLGARAVLGHMETPDDWLDAASDADVLVQLGSTATRRSSMSWVQAGSEKHRSASAGLIAAAQRGDRAPVVITASALQVLGHHGDQWIDEQTAPNPMALSSYWAPNEELVIDARAAGVDAVALRLGQVYGPAPDGFFATMFLKMAEKGRFRYMGDGSNYYPFVHVDDVVDAILDIAAKRPATPVLHLVDDDPLTMVESANLITDQFGREAKGIPTWLGRLVAGTPIAEGFVGSYRSRNELAKSALEWTPAHPSLRTEIGNVVAAFRALTR